MCGYSVGWAGMHAWPEVCGGGVHGLWCVDVGAGARIRRCVGGRQKLTLN